MTTTAKSLILLSFTLAVGFALGLFADATLVPGDCRIEWNEGGVTRDRAATLAVIDDVVARYIAARIETAHRGPEETRE